MYKKLIIILISITYTSGILAYSYNSIYGFAGVIPIITDNHNQKWVYLALEYNKKQKQLAIMAGQKNKSDKNSIETANREFQEESLDVFNQYINTNTLKKLQKNKMLDELTLTYDILFLLSTKIYLIPIDNKYLNKKVYLPDLSSDKCDYFIDLYNQRRFNKPYNYNKLTRSQRENHGIRKVKLQDLIAYLKNPANFNYKLPNYDAKDCNHPDNLPLRWSSRIILQNQPAIDHL